MFLPNNLAYSYGDYGRNPNFDQEMCATHRHNYIGYVKSRLRNA